MKKDCPFKFEFKSINLTKCCLVIGYDCPGEDKCEMKKYRKAQEKIWKRVNGNLVRK